MGRARLKDDGTAVEVLFDGSERPIAPEVDWGQGRCDHGSRDRGSDRCGRGRRDPRCRRLRMPRPPPPGAEVGAVMDRETWLERILQAIRDLCEASYQGARLGSRRRAGGRLPISRP